MKSSSEGEAVLGKKKKKKKKWTGCCLKHYQGIQATQQLFQRTEETILIALIAFLRKKLIAVGLLRDFPVLQYCNTWYYRVLSFLLDRYLFSLIIICNWKPITVHEQKSYSEKYFIQCDKDKTSKTE